MKADSKFLKGNELNILWFRGQDDDYKIRPGIFRFTTREGTHREPTKKMIEDRLIEEGNILNDFFIHAPQCIDRQPDDGWEWMAIAQHHRLPTRLVDWTENCLHALFFAISSWNPMEEERKPTVFVLNPFQIVKGYIPIVAENSRLAKWLPETMRFFKIVDRHYDTRPTKIPGEKKLGCQPVPIYVPHVDERMSSQAGCFTLHGEFTGGLEDYLREHGREKFMRKLQLKISKDPCEQKRKILQSLRSLGINAFTAYKSLDALSDHLKEIYLTPAKK